MKTIFKVGMKVYDQLNFPDKEGKVVDICKDERVTSPITVIFKDKYDEEIERYYTSDGRYKIDKLPVLSTKPYQIILQGFEQKAPAKTYEEAVEWLKNNSKDRVIYADEAYINEEYERAFEALRKLTILRDFYNEGWKPDWEDEKNKFCIEVENGKPRLEIWRDRSRVLAFKSHEIAYNFLEDQRELLEIAKPLL